MKKFLLFLFSFSFLFAFDTLWFRVYDTEWGELCYEIGIDPLGNVVISGETRYGILLLKYSPSGETIWSRIIDDEDRLYGASLAIDKEGNMILVGCYYREPELGAYIFKCDNEGNILWSKKFTIDNGCALLGVICDDSNNIIVVGYYYNDEDEEDIILIKYSPNGDSIWAKRYDFGEPFERVARLTIDRDGNIIATGLTGSLIPCIYDLLTVKFYKNGDLIWASWINFKEQDWGEETGIDSFNNIYVCGTCADFEPYFLLLIKYNQDGDTIWTRFYENSLGLALSIDKLGNILVTGYTVENGIANTLLIKYSPFGETILSKRFNFSPGGEMWASDMVLINDSNYIYITGTFYDGRDDDIYLMKLLYYPAISEKFSKKILSTSDKAKEIYDITGKKIKDLRRLKKGVYFFKDKYFKKVIILSH